MPSHDLQPTASAPFGTSPRRARWPLVTLIVVFVAWFGFLVWLALRFPARG